MLPEVCLVCANELNCSHPDCVNSPGLFSKGGGKNGRHGWIISTGVQLFKYAFLRMFRAVHGADAHLRTKRYELIPARQLLTVLQKMLCSLEGAYIEKSCCLSAPQGEDLPNYSLARVYQSP